MTDFILKNGFPYKIALLSAFYVFSGYISSPQAPWQAQQKSVRPSLSGRVAEPDACIIVSCIYNVDLVDGYAFVSGQDAYSMLFVHRYHVP